MDAKARASIAIEKIRRNSIYEDMKKRTDLSTGSVSNRSYLDPQNLLGDHSMFERKRSPLLENYTEKKSPLFNPVHERKLSPFLNTERNKSTLMNYQRSLIIDTDQNDQFENLKKQNEEMYSKLQYTHSRTLASPTYKQYLND